MIANRLFIFIGLLTETFIDVIRIIGGLCCSGIVCRYHDWGEVWITLLKDVQRPSLWPSLLRLMPIICGILERDGHRVDRIPCVLLMSANRWVIVFLFIACSGAVTGVGPNARRRNHLKTPCLCIQYLISHWEWGYVSVNWCCYVAYLLTFFPPGWWAGHRDAPCVHYRCHVLNRGQEREDHRVLEIWTILCKLTLALLRLEGPLRIARSLRDYSWTLTIQVLQAI